ncbi:auxin-responsive protein SAUR68 [Eucalyptus grandis]|uniref:auxin-responsive protein SAUR68 n=1 Tax=Eucalyptus grandis TaxID=71139 RepID=UPI00192ECD9E|nr:auxin-responsive protein SAUR68 [Eucalyptus grandis]
MISTKKLFNVARKWQKITAIGRKRISHRRTRRPLKADSCRMLEVSKKGHFIICSTDRRRFAIPLACLNTYIFQELLKLSEEEYGLSSDGLITLPFDAATVEYTVSLTRRGLTEDLQRALLNTISSCHCSSYDSMIKAV